MLVGELDVILLVAARIAPNELHERQLLAASVDCGAALRLRPSAHGLPSGPRIMPLGSGCALLSASLLVSVFATEACCCSVASKGCGGIPVFARTLQKKWDRMGYGVSVTGMSPCHPMAEKCKLVLLTKHVVCASWGRESESSIAHDASGHLQIMDAWRRSDQHQYM